MINEVEFSGKIEDILQLMEGRFSIDEKYESIVKEIINNVKANKEDAIVQYTNMYDSKTFVKENMKVSNDEIKSAYTKVEKEFIVSIKKAIKNIEKFHKKQLRNSWMDYGDDGEVLGMKISPLNRVGLYVPGGQGGTTPLVSSVLMNGIPAKVAGVKEIVMVSPPNKENEISPYLLVTADLIGINEIYKMGSAWAVAALAYGLEMMKPVNKIVGPGNIFVTVAKKMLYGHVDIDMIAGPSEILIIADKHADPEYLAADFLSQAEHDVMAASIIITDSKDIIDETKKEIEKQTEQLSRKDMIKKSLKNNGYIIYVQDLEDAFAISNQIAPEHLELEIENPFNYISKVENAGAIFLGKYTPEPVGDYFAGPNHVLPTNMTAKFYSPLNVDDFIKKTSIVYYPKDLLLKNADDIIRIAEVEGLTAHANAVRVRKKELD